jgi:hypothetical protein
VVVALAAGSGVYAWQQSDGKPTSAPSSSPEPVAMPTASPLNPGIEPPKDGTWPAKWPKFSATDAVRTFPDLDGLGFTLKVPPQWECKLGGRAAGYVKYNCGQSAGSDLEIGGELVVRECPQPCNADRQTTMRSAEEAWGVQWARGGQFATWGESSTLQIDGQRRHGLVVVAFFRGGGEQIDRELVLRMTAPVDQSQPLRRVANYLHDTLIF